MFNVTASNIDFMAQYRLVDKNNLEKYGRAFAVEDEDEDDIITFEVSMFVNITYCH